MTNILTAVKSTLGITEEQKNFDNVILLHINSAIGYLTQVGVPLSEGFDTVTETTTWDELCGQTSKLPTIKTYIGLRVRMFFDPPTSGVGNETMLSQIKEMEWRLVVSTDTLNKQ